MKIHTSTILPNDLADAVNGISGVEVHFKEANSRSHRRAFEVALRGSDSRHTRPPNTGITGARSGERAATYDDWGLFISYLLDVDPGATCGPYRGRDDFHRTTQGAYRR